MQSGLKKITAKLVEGVKWFFVGLPDPPVPPPPPEPEPEPLPEARYAFVDTEDGDLLMGEVLDFTSDGISLGAVTVFRTKAKTSLTIPYPGLVYVPMHRIKIVQDIERLLTQTEIQGKLKEGEPEIAKNVDPFGHSLYSDSSAKRR